MRLDKNSATLRPKRTSRKHAAIIAAARDVFFREGYSGASMDAITALAGVSKATVYNHFRSKEELLLAVVEDVIAPFRDDYLAVMDHSQTFKDWLLQLANIMARKVMMPEVTALERLVIAEGLRFPELGRIFETTVINSSFDLFRPRIEQAIAEGDMRPCDPLVAIGHFAEMCAGTLQRKLLFNAGRLPENQDVTHHVTEFVEVFLHGYGGRQSP